MSVVATLFTSKVFWEGLLAVAALIGAGVGAKHAKAVQAKTRLERLTELASQVFDVVEVKQGGKDGGHKQIAFLMIVREHALRAGLGALSNDEIELLKDWAARRAIGDKVTQQKPRRRSKPRP